MTDVDRSSSGPYVFGLEHVPLPALVCDESGTLLWVNDHFTEISGLLEVPPNTGLSSLIYALEEDVDTTPTNAADGEAPMQVLINGESYIMYTGSIGELTGCVFAPRDKLVSFSQVPPPLDRKRSSKLPPTGNSLLEAFISMSRKLNLTMKEEELIGLFVGIYKDLFPGRLLSIRLLDKESRQLSYSYANGTLRQASDAYPLKITSQTLSSYGLDEPETAALLEKSRTIMVDRYETIFAEGVEGFEIPISDSSAFYGLINFEYQSKNCPKAADRAVAVPIAHQMCAALRNARLLNETTVLKDYLEKLVDQANALVIVVGRDRRITLCNQAIERHTGYTREQLIGSDLMSFFPDTEKARLLPVIISVMRGESKAGIEIRLPRADDKEGAHIIFNMAPILSANFELEGVIFVGQELTDIHKLENQIIHSEKLVTLGQIAAGVAHELNNPLTSISVYADYLAKNMGDRLEKGDLEKIGRIVEAAERIRSFTKDLVTYARPSSEEPTLIRLSELLERSLSFCEHIVTQSGTDVVLDVADGVQLIYGVHGHLEQVFVNLITNACHALERPNGLIRLSAFHLDEDRIKILVEDNGKGIAKEHLKDIFEPFFTTKPEGQGTGLGLSIVRNILLNHNAEIAVESTPGKGTTFEITMYAGKQAIAQSATKSFVT